MSRNRHRTESADSIDTSTSAVEPVEPTSDTSTVEQADDTSTVEPTSDTSTVEQADDTSTSTSTVEPTSDTSTPAVDRTSLVTALRVSWSAATIDSTTGTVPAVDLAPVIDAWRALVPTFKPSERTALVATIAAELSADFIAAEKILPALAVHQVRTALDQATQKVAVVVDPRRDAAIKLAALRSLVDAAEQVADDDTKALADTIAGDDRALVVLVDRIRGTLNRKTSHGASSTTSGDRKPAESLDAVVSSVATFTSVGDLAKSSGRSRGAIENVWTAMKEGRRSIAGFAAIERDGKKGFEPIG